jgi:molecular chaperone Hsp33
VQSDLQLRATATLSGAVAPQASLADLVNPQGQARCVITLDPQDRRDGQQPYQGVVPLLNEQGVAMGSVAEALQFYMRQSEQLETTLVLASNEHMSAGLLIQRLPILGQGNLAGAATSTTDKEHIDETMVENYSRIATLASSLTSEELLTLDMDTVLHRLFWEEPLQQIRPKLGQPLPHFGCTCSRERVSYMIQGLGQAEAQDILAEQGAIQVGCEFCGASYRFDAVDTSQLFTSAGIQPPSSPSVQ